jgi:hypothetical protein
LDTGIRATRGVQLPHTPQQDVPAATYYPSPYLYTLYHILVSIVSKGVISK